MRKRALTTLTAGLLLLSPGFTPTAEAGVRWSVGAGFAVGGIHFSLAFGGRDHHRHSPSYYYRTEHSLHYRGVECSDRCYLDSRSHGYTNHHASCPLVRHHFRVFRVYPVEVFDAYAPAPVWDGREWEVDYDDYGFDDRPNRRGRVAYYDDSRDGRRYDSHERDRYRHRSSRDERRGYHHRHDRSCGHDWRHRSDPP